jgi:general secretion pathway protein A
MYNEYFGFKEAPFSIAPDPRYLYMTAQHREALAHLVYGLNSEGGCILLTGEVGTGKTTICRCLLEQIPDQANVALVLNPKVSEVELLETICDELKIDYPDADNSLKTYTDRIYQFLIESNRNNEKTVLIIDEAQNLSSPVLEQLRLLTNLETNQRKLLQIIILGQPELLDILARNEMRQLAQRITARFHLQPLTKSEVKAYVSHRLAISGQNIQIFPEKSIRLLYKLSNGVPRLINILCDRALLGAYVEGQYAVHPPIIKKAAKEVFGELKNVEDQHKNRQWLYPIAALSGVTVFAIAVFLYLTLSPVSDRENKTDVNTSAAVNTETQQPDILSTAPSAEQTPAGEMTVSTGQTDEEIPAAAEMPPTENAAKKVMAAMASPDTKNNTEKNIQTGSENIEKILNNKNSNPVSAYQALFNAWNHDYNNKVATTACKQAEAFSLRCLHKQGNLNSLKIHNRPAVLTLINHQGKPCYVTITSIQDGLATVYSNNSEYKVKLSELNKYWYGQFILLWHKPEFYSSAINPGDSGNIVNWLSAHFSGKQSTAGRKIYKNDLIEKVKTFQTQHSLIADGIVGPVTIIHLNSESGMKVPTLTRQS